VRNERKDAEQTGVAAGADSAPPARAWWRLPLLLAVVLAAIVTVRSTRVREQIADTHEAPSPSADATGKTVSLIIQFGDNRERRFDPIPWHPGMNVDDLMTVASRLPNGITYGAYGDHEQMMLNQIDETYNERGRGRNWTFQVNGTRADRSLAVYELQPGDRVLWTYGQPD